MAFPRLRQRDSLHSVEFEQFTLQMEFGIWDQHHATSNKWPHRMDGTNCIKKCQEGDVETKLAHSYSSFHHWNIPIPSLEYPQQKCWWANDYAHTWICWRNITCSEWCSDEDHRISHSMHLEDVAVCGCRNTCCWLSSVTISLNVHPIHPMFIRTCLKLVLGLDGVEQLSHHI